MTLPAPGPAAAWADAVALLHLGVVLFVVGGLPLVWWGVARGWAWVRRPGWRVLHLAVIGLVVVQSWLGMTCPLTWLEDGLRAQAGQTAAGPPGFIQRWVHRLIFFEAPAAVFAAVYTVFGAAVAWTWWRWPPRR